MQGCTSGPEEAPAAAQAGALLVAPQLCGKAPEGPRGQQAEREPATCPCAGEGQAYPGLCSLEHSQQESPGPLLEHSWWDAPGVTAHCSGLPGARGVNPA